MKTCCTKETWRLKEAKCQAKDTNKAYMMNTHLGFTNTTNNTATNKTAYEADMMNTHVFTNTSTNTATNTTIICTNLNKYN